MMAKTIALLVCLSFGLLAFSSVAAESGSETEVAELGRRLVDGDRDERRKAAYALQALGEKAAPMVSPLTEALEDEDDQVWHEATMALAAIGPAAAPAIPALIEQMGGGRSRYEEQRRHRSAFALSRIGAAALPALEEALEDENAHRRWGALHALGLMGVPEEAIRRKMVELLGDEEEMVRLEAEEAFVALGEPMLDMVAGRLKHADPRVRERVAHMLRRAPSEAAASYGGAILSALLGERDDAAKGALLQAAAAVGADPEFLMPLAMEALLAESATRRDAAFDLITADGALADECVPVLSLLLGDPSPEHRELAARLLGRLGERAVRAAPVMIDRLEVLSPGDVEEARWYEQALILIGPGVIDPILDSLRKSGPEAIDSDHWAVRTLSALAPVALPDLEKALMTGSPPMACAVLQSFPHYSKRQRVVERQVLRFLGDEEARLRALAVASLSRLKLPDAVWRRSVVQAVNDAAVEVRVAALNALSGVPMGNPERLEILMEALDADSLEVRRAAVEQIGELRAAGQPALPVLLSTAEAKEATPAYRIAVVQTLGRMGDGAAEGVPFLRRLLDEPASGTGSLRPDVLVALGAIGRAAEPALESVEALLSSDDESLRRSALFAYGKIEKNAEKLVPLYREALKDASPEVRLPAIEGLGRLGEGGEPAAEDLVGLLDSETDQRASLEALREIEPRDVGLCLRMLEHESPGVRLLACDRLGRLRAEEAIPALRKALRDEYRFVRRRAREALERMERDG